MTPEQQQQLLALVSSGDQDPLVQQQLAQAQSLMQGSGKRYSSTLGALGGGLADVLNAYRGTKMQQEAQGKQQSALDAKAKARQAFLDAMNPQPTAAAPGAALGKMQPPGGMGGAPDAQGLMGQALQPKPVDPRIQQLQTALFGASSGDPFMAKMGGFQLQQAEGQQARQSEMDKLGLRARLDREKEDRDRAWDREKFRQEMGLKRTSLERDKEKDGIKQVGDLRQEFIKLDQTKKMQSALDGAKAVAGATPNGAGDLVLIYGFNNLIDPGALTREQDVITIGRAGGLPAQVQGYAAELIGEGKLSDASRRELRAEASKLLKSRLQSFRPTLDFYGQQAGRMGLPPEEVLGNYGSIAQALQWASENPADPRAQKVVNKALGLPDE